MAITQKVAGKKLNPNLKLVAQSVEDASYYKIGVFGPPGSGKTRIIVTLIQLGFRVFVADTDFGGNGLRTVREELKKVNRLDLLRNLVYFEFPDKETMEQFIWNPEVMYVSDSEGKQVKLWDWDPDWIVWEGFSNFQLNMIEPEVLALDPATSNASEHRQIGLLAEQKDWDAIKRATLRPLDAFLKIHSPKGKRIHKLVTIHQGEPKEDKTTGEMQVGPLIQGSARFLVGAGFDLVINTRALSDRSGTKYWYYVETSDKVAAKKRGFDLGKVDGGRIAADFGDLWHRMTGETVPPFEPAA